ncbi:biosynthetic arginine decarboxylase [Magnetovibrio sp.]|uniref:biosynthetic arginine decarboxylase n=1 Tax=Magnetovibrio sp. TaxID=2024836 RepID=UPI002F9351BB
MAEWTTDDAEELYRIQRWSDGYFGISDDGKLLALPDVGKREVPVALQDVVDELREQNVQFPVVMRFHDILKNRVRQLNEAFATAIAEAEYQAPYRGVYPIKVNQMREVVDEIVSAGRPFHYGLEAGSKPELMAVLSYDTGEEALTICNGYKDEDFLRLALLGRKLGRKVVVVIEKYSEIEPLLKLAAEMEVEPIIGLRIKMRVKTEGRWSESSGERAKFGLTTSEILNAIALIEKRGYGDAIRLLHFHVGSQLSEIRFVREAVQEAARIYARLVKRGIPLTYLDIGGGLAVDYDGSRSSGHSSMNYTMDDYANGVVYAVKQVCDLEEVPHPTLVTESGRAISAHHSCVVIRVMGEIANDANPIATDPVEGEHILVTNMRDLLSSLAEAKNYQDVYNEASLLLEDVLSAFKLGVIGLEELARTETLYWRLMRAVAKGLETEEFVSEDLRNVESLLGSQYLCNFSLFQSAADSWAIQQVLPVAPLTRLNEAPSRNCTLADITCDSDGRIAQFIGEQGERSVLPLHNLKADESYFIGLFLTGAYQDVMGDMHNLFGRLNEAHIYSDPNDPTGFYIEELLHGSSAAQVLEIMQYNPKAMAGQVKAMIDRTVAQGGLRSRDGVKLVDFYEQCLASYTYLRQTEPGART